MHSHKPKYLHIIKNNFENYKKPNKYFREKWRSFTINKTTIK